jgi:putative PIN family toxin of toxin-antitoxin system
VRVVLDANVLISGTITPGGLSGRILDAWRAQSFVLCTGGPITQELSDAIGDPNLNRRYRELATAGTDLVEALRIAAAWPHRPVEPITIARDPKDNMVLECAIGCEADLIVTNDDDLLALKAHEGIGIVSIRDFLRTLGVV